jgi:secretion/DNA translocation related TadE-like protein
VTILAAGILVVLAVAALGVTDVWKVLAARSRAQTAADAAALAAAQDVAWPIDDPDPTASAAAYAAANDATLVACAIGSQSVLVETEAAAGPLALFPDDLRVRAAARAVVGADPAGVGS